MTEIISSPIAAESGHWYTRDGKPAYTIVGANGKERPTTLRDAKKIGLYTSVTNVIRLAAAPGLDRYKRRQVFDAVQRIPREAGESDEAYFARIELAAQELAIIARDRGTVLHGAFERHFTGLPVDDSLVPWVIEMVGELEKECGRQEWRAERSFSSPAGYGGKIDLHSDEWVIDFKGKDGLDDLRLWDEHFCQLGAYRMMLDHPCIKTVHRCGILFVDRNRPAAKFVEAKESDLQKGEAMFLALLQYHRAKTGYAP